MSVPEKDGASPKSPPKGTKKPRRATAPRPDEMSTEVCEFLTAIDDYKRAHMRSFLSLDEVFEVFSSLGYRPEGAQRLDKKSLDSLTAAIDQYKREQERLFPSWSEIFKIAGEQGWRRSA